MTRPDWAQSFPKLYELYSGSDYSNEANYFRQVGVRNALEARKDSIRKLEKELQELDDAAWQKFKIKTLNYVCKRDERRQSAQLFECFHEVKGYIYLKKEGYEEIHFIDEVNTRTPDLRARRNQSIALMEVKTVNESDEEVDYIGGKLDYFDSELNRKVRPAMKWTKELVNDRYDKLKLKLKKTIDLAKTQLFNFYSNKGVRKVIYLVLRFDSHFEATGNLDELAEFIKSQGDEQIEVVHLFL